MAQSRPRHPCAIRRPVYRRATLALILLSALIVTSAATWLPSPRHGGTIFVTWQDTLGTLDPAYVYTAAEWPEAHALFDGLLGFDRGTGLVPDLATSMPVVSHDGKVYTFHLRHGLVFSNGDPVTAQDVVYSFERELAPKTASPITYLWYALAGVNDYTAGKTKHVGGLKALDRYTLQMTLSQPYPPFLYVLAIPAGMVVDPAVVQKYHAEHSDLKAHLVGTGPFMIKDWVPSQKLDLVRNPRHVPSDLPYVDAVHLDLGIDASVGLLRLEKGQVDVVGDGIPAAQFANVITTPRLNALVQRRTDVGVYTIALNTKIKPFNNRLVRQAIAYALDKERAIRFINGRGVPATGIIPTAMPGFDPNIPDPYPYNPAKARQSLARAGYPHGFSTTLGVATNVYLQRMGDAVEYDLAAVGIRLTIKTVQSEGTAIATLPMQTHDWLMDYPDPADFVDGFTSCAAAAPGSSNVAFYCNPAIDALANAARGLPLGAARTKAYKEIDRRVMADAPYVPLFYDVVYFIHSPRLQGYYISPMWYPFTLEQYWLVR